MAGGKPVSTAGLRDDRRRPTGKRDPARRTVARGLGRCVIGPMPFRALVIWLALLLVAVANGAFRETMLIPRFGSQTGHIVSTLMLCAGILIVTYVAVPWIQPSASRGSPSHSRSGLVARAASLGPTSSPTMTS